MRSASEPERPLRSETSEQVADRGNFQPGTGTRRTRYPAVKKAA